MQLDAIQDFKRVNPDWKDTLRPTKIPTTEGQFGSNGESIWSVRQSRLGVRGTVPARRWPVNFKLEFDFFGVGTTAGKPTPNLRHAYTQFGPFIAGQTWSVFMDPDAAPYVLDRWGPNGSISARNPQISWTPVTGRDYCAVGLEGVSQSLDVGTFSAAVGPGQEAKSVQHLPDITAQYRINRSWGHLMGAGVYRQLSVEVLDVNSTVHEGGSVPGGGVNVASAINTGGGDRLLVSAAFGKGIGTYFADSVQDVGTTVFATPFSAPSEPIHAAIPARGFTAYYDHIWNPTWRSSAGYSFSQLDNLTGESKDAFHQGEYASVNLLHYPREDLIVGAEFLWGKRTDVSRASGTDYRIQFSLRYSFVQKL